MKYIWLDCDPGHDDATAILLAIHSPDIKLLGVSTVHGNTSAESTKINAARCLHVMGAPPEVMVYPGALRPLIRTARFDPEIHGIDGLGGVVGLPKSGSDEVKARLETNGTTTRATEGIAAAIRKTWQEGTGHQVTVVSSGPMTNIALFIMVYPELLDGIEQFVFMGGGIGIGNRSSAAEFNILCDPEAAQIVLDTPVKKTMIPLNVTHTALVNKQVQAQLRAPGIILQDSSIPLPVPTSPLRLMLATLISFFAEAYETVFGFVQGPPIHDALTIAYVCKPELFTYARMRVDVELNGAHTAGETVADLYDYGKYTETWGRTGKNCYVTQSLNVDGFFEYFLECVTRCDAVSPLNHKA